MIQAGVDSIYRQFLGIVAQARRKTPAEIDRIAQGRVWDGGTARQIGLVDQFGGLDDAIAKVAAGLAKLGDERRACVTSTSTRPRSRNSWRCSATRMRQKRHRPMPSPRSPRRRRGCSTLALADLKRILSGPSIQVRCLDCPVTVRPTAAPEREGWKAMLTELFS